MKLIDGIDLKIQMSGFISEIYEIISKKIKNINLNKNIYYSIYIIYF